MEIICILIGILTTQIYTFVKTYGTLPLKCVYFIICNAYFDTLISQIKKDTFPLVFSYQQQQQQ